MLDIQYCSIKTLMIPNVYYKPYIEHDGCH